MDFLKHLQLALLIVTTLGYSYQPLPWVNTLRSGQELYGNNSQLAMHRRGEATPARGVGTCACTPFRSCETGVLS